MREGSLIAAVIISALLFGAVEPWSMALASIFIAFAFISFACTAEKNDFASAGRKGLMISLALCLLYPLFQLLPLPVSILGAVQEKFTDIVTLSPKAAPAFHSISLYPFATEMDFSRMLIYAMVFSAAAFGIRGEDGVHRVIKTLAVFGFILAIFGIIQHATWNGKIYWFRELTYGGAPFGPFVNRNHFAGFVGMIIPLSLGISPIVERFMRTNVSGEQRFAAWQGTLSAFRDFPLFGSGMGTFQHIFKVYQPDGLTLYWDHAHNDYLELLLEAGIIGTLIAAAFFFSLFRIMVKAEWKGRDIYLGAAFFASITTMAVHSITDFNLHIPSNAILFSLILGLGVAMSKEQV